MGWTLCLTEESSSSLDVECEKMKKKKFFSLITQNSNFFNNTTQKLKTLNKRAMRYTHIESYTECNVPVSSAGCTCQEVLLTVLKTLNNHLPSYINNMFKLRTTLRTWEAQKSLSSSMPTPHGHRPEVYGILSDQTLPDKFSTSELIEEFSTSELIEEF